MEQSYDVEKFEIPTQEKSKVDRFAYLPKPNDSDTVLEIKDVITLILDKIEDTHDQIGIRKNYEDEKKKIIQEKKNDIFKPV